MLKSVTWGVRVPLNTIITLRSIAQSHRVVISYAHHIHTHDLPTAANTSSLGYHGTVFNDLSCIMSSHHTTSWPCNIGMVLGKALRVAVTGFSMHVLVTLSFPMYQSCARYWHDSGASRPQPTGRREASRVRPARSSRAVRLSVIEFSTCR